MENGRHQQDIRDLGRAELRRLSRRKRNRFLAGALIFACSLVVVGLLAALILLVPGGGGGRKVPDLVGMTYESAMRRAQAAGLSIDVDPGQDTASVEDIGKRRVEGQNPKAGTVAEEDEKIEVRLKGLKDLSETAAENSTAPDVGEGGSGPGAGTGGASTPAPDTTPRNPEPRATPAGRVVCIDPGHSTGFPPSEIDAATGLDVADNGGAPGELQANWELALKVRAGLEQAGYGVRLTKGAADSYVSLRTRADIGNQCSIMVRLHFDPDLHALLYPGRGQFKQHGSSVVYVDPEVAAGSEALAQAMFPYLRNVGVTRKMNDTGGTSNNTGPAYVVSVLSKVPVVLIENDPAMVRGNTAGQERVADAIVKGVMAYFQNL